MNREEANDKTRLEEASAGAVSAWIDTADPDYVPHEPLASPDNQAEHQSEYPGLRPAPPALTTEGLMQLAEDDVPDPQFLFGDSWFNIDGPGMIAGPPSAGKSMFLMNMIVNQIVGKPFCGHTSNQSPQKWLILGNENSRKRNHRDAVRFTKNLTAEEKNLVDKYAIIQKLDHPSDYNLTLTSREIPGSFAQRLHKTILEEKPDWVTIDALSSLLDASAMDDAAVKRVIEDFTTIIKAASVHTQPLFVAHARRDINSLKKFDTIEAADMVFGSQAATRLVRFVLFMARLDITSDRIVTNVIKNNDGREYDKLAVYLPHDGDNFLVDYDYDLTDINKLLLKKGASSSIPLKLLIEELKHGPKTFKELHSHFGGSGFGTDKDFSKSLSLYESQGYIENKRGEYTATELGAKAFHNPFKQEEDRF